MPWLIFEAEKHALARGAHIYAEVIGAGTSSDATHITNPNAEGDATAYYVAERLGDAGVRLTRIAYGMPLGGDLEYADHVTIGLSMDNRRSID